MGDGLEASEDLSEHTEVLVHVAFNSADFAASLQLFAQIHIYSRIEMSGFALKDWWGLPPTLTGLTLPQATATVKHALLCAHAQSWWNRPSSRIYDNCQRSETCVWMIWRLGQQL